MPSQNEATSPPDISSDLDRLPNPTRTSPFLANRTPSFDHDTRLTLKGFIELDDARAVLHVDDTVCVMKAGDRARGLEIIEVSPPSLIYRISGTERTLTLRH